MIDTHCHLYSDELANDIEAVIDRAIEAGVDRFYLPAIDSSTTTAMLALEQKFPDKCFAMAGLHPCSVKENFEEELRHVEALLAERPFAGVGEAGLDFYWDVSFKEQQYKALERQIQLALEYELPLILHTRNAMAETIAVVSKFAGSGLRGIFHCFGGTLKEAQEIIEMDFLLGIGGVVTYKKSTLPLVLSDIDLKHLVLETDAPYLAPVPYRGKRNESSYLPEVAKHIALIKNTTIEVVDRITSENALALFRKK
ncbi:MAG: TatD family deoxyribonuclease [Chitinophagaceae bacterium]|nr:MAG: TatD family deoxyribonuclease [Chitinophagaceae bacterium]